MCVCVVVVMVVVGLLIQHQQPFTPHVWVIPRCRDMPRQVTHCSRATTLGGAARSSSIPPLQPKLCQTKASAGRNN